MPIKAKPNLVSVTLKYTMIKIKIIEYYTLFLQNKYHCMIKTYAISNRLTQENNVGKDDLKKKN